MRWEHWFYTLPLRIKSLFRRSEVEAELDEELRYHLDRQTEANRAAGMPDVEARRAAAVRLGGIEGRKEECRDALGWRTLDTLQRDTKQAARRLTRDWQFSAGAILILSLGIGVNTAVFSIFNNTLFRPYPFADSARLVNLYQNGSTTGEPEGVSYPAFLDLSNHTALFSGVSAYDTDEGRYQAVDAQGRPTGIHAGLFEYASANHLEVLGMKPSLGRWFTADEERSGAPVAVLGRRTWERHFGADTNAIGQTIRVRGRQVQVIGVGPVELNNSNSNAGFASLWMPIHPIDVHRPGGTGVDSAGLSERRDSLFLQVRARLRDGVTIQQAQAAMDVTAQRLAADYPDTDPKRGITVLATDDVRLHPRSEKILKPTAALVLAVVGLVLAIACSNLATLLLVRNTTRTTEVSVRLALGAGRWQLVRHLLMESVILLLLGAAVGIALAAWGLRYVATFDLPVQVSMQLDYRVLGFATAVATLCGVGFGLTPALKATRGDLVGALREQQASSMRSFSLARSWLALKNVLIVGQVAGSFLLLMGGALAMSILMATQSRSVGYSPSGLAMIELDARFADYDAPRARIVFEELRRHVAGLPGVEYVLVTTGLPAGGQFNSKLRPDGDTSHDYVSVRGRWADPGYFETLGIPRLFGRGFDERDAPGSPEAAVVSETFARQFFGTPNALGKRFRFEEADTKPVEIVGVVGDTRNIDLVSEAPQPFYYRSARQAGLMPAAIVARVSRNEAELAGLMQQEVRRLHPELTVIAAETMVQRQRKDLLPFRIGILSLGGLGALGLTLAGVGLYAVVAFAVARRSREIGIRIALGAQPGSLTWARRSRGDCRCPRGHRCRIGAFVGRPDRTGIGGWVGSGRRPADRGLRRWDHRSRWWLCCVRTGATRGPSQSASCNSARVAHSKSPLPCDHFRDVLPVQPVDATLCAKGEG